MPADPEAHLPLHPLEFRVLLAVLGGPSHGYAIVKEIEAREQGTIYPANLYRRIRELLSRGLLEDVAAPGGEDPEGRRRYVAVTRLGRAVARAEARRLEALVREARAAHLVSQV